MEKQKKRIMIVEDEIYNAEALKYLLEELNYNPIYIASSGEDAILKSHELKPDLILMDIVLKGEIDGIEAAKAIILKNNIPIIFITAYSNHDLIERAKEVEPYGYIVKPISEVNDIQPTIEITFHNHNIKKILLRNNKKYEKIEQFLQGKGNLSQFPSQNPADSLDQLDIQKNFEGRDFKSYCSTLGNKERIKIIKFLINGQKRFEAIKNLINKTKSTVSHHIKLLEINNVVKGTRKGKFTFYSLRKDLEMFKLIEMEGIEKTSALYNALGSNERLEILKLLGDGSKNSDEIDKSLSEKAKSTITHHLKILEKDLFITSEKKGHNSFYSLNNDNFKIIFQAFSDFISINQNLIS